MIKLATSKSHVEHSCAEHIVLKIIFVAPRVAASKALSAILKEVPLWSENFPDIKSEFDVDNDFDEEAFSMLIWSFVESHGKANQVVDDSQVNLDFCDLLETIEIIATLVFLMKLLSEVARYESNRKCPRQVF